VAPRHVYVHVPFCARRCSYCDFAIAVRARVPVGEYVAALRGELELRFADAPVTAVETVYLGGGTPSRLGPAGVAEVVRAVADRFPPTAGAEITLEANPDDVTPAAVAAWRADGLINRVSLGVQSFDDRALRWMHRTHDAVGVERAVAALGEGGLENWSLDLIFALPAELGRVWERDLERAIALRPPHLSLYGLTVEAHTPIARWRDRGACVEAREEEYEHEYLLASTMLRSAGYEHYEVSNFGQPGYRSRHNRGYWAGASYVGLGPAAHGFDGHARRWNEREYSAWLRKVRERTDPLGGCETLTEENRVSEQVYLGLRTCEGVALAPDELETARRWVDEGWGRIDAGRLRLSAAGWLRLDALAASLTARRSR
jgi:oxygen-independent coproporphyrinogen-3 oxidase